MHWGCYYLPTSLPASPSAAEAYLRCLRGQVRYAEALGFESVWLAEHHFQAFGGLFPSPALLGTALALETQRLRIGTGVVLLPFHDPLRVAEDYATLDLLSGGRLEFGVGHGFLRWEAHNFGLAAEHQRERFREHLDIVRLAWTQPIFSFQGRFHQYENLSVWPKPLQQPHPTIWMAATGSVESFELAGQRGYRLMLIPFLHDVGELREKVQVYLSAFEAAGHDPRSRRVLAVYHTHVAETDAAAQDAAESGVMEYIGASTAGHALAQHLQSPSAQPPAPHRAAVRALTFGDLVERQRVVIGSSRSVAERLRFLIEQLSLTDVVGLFALGGLADQEVRASMRRFMDEVAPIVP